MKKWHLVIGFLLVLANTSGQVNNLVPNGDFENILSCPDNGNQLTRAYGWFSPSYATPDLLAACSSLNLIGVPENNFGYQNAFFGLNCAHILTDNLAGWEYEYVSNELTYAMEKDKIYEVVYRVSLADFSTHGMDRMGVLFTVTKPFFATTSRINEVPQLSTPKGFVLADTANWIEIRDSFVAEGGEHFLTIGQFFPNDSLTFTYLPNPALTWASYYIDGVEVNEIKEMIDTPILPNIFSPNHDGVNEFYEIENLPEGSTLEVFNRWGSLVFKEAPYQNNWPGNAPNGQPVADGVYFAILTYQDAKGIVQQKKQTVHIFR